MGTRFKFPALTKLQREHNAYDLENMRIARIERTPFYAARVRLFAFDGDEGALLDVSPDYWNLVVTVGKDLMLDRLFGLSSAVALSSIGVGTENLAAAVGQTRLNPSGGGTVLIQTNDAGTSRSAETVTAQSTYGTGVGNFVWAETGQFNGNVNGTSVMFDRIAPIGPFTKTSAVSIVDQIQTTQA